MDRLPRRRPQHRLASCGAGATPDDAIVAAFNFTPVPRYGYRVGVAAAGDWSEILNSDAAEYGGSGVGNRGGADALAVPAHGRPHSLSLTLPPLGAVFLKPAPPDSPLAEVGEAEAAAEIDAAIEAAMGAPPPPPAAR